MPDRTAAIVIVGDEILSGHTLDTNSQWLATRLRDRGVRLLRIEEIPDDAREIEVTLRRILARDAPSFLFVVGGIGPTPDDRTYEGVGRALGVELTTRPEHVEWIRRLLRRRGLTKQTWADPARSESVQRMVRLPKGSDSLENPVGTALGCVAPSGESRVVVLPGVPRELYAMFDRSFGPRFLSGSRRSEVVRELEVWGYEASLWEDLMAVERAHPKVRLGSYPQDERGRILLRITGPAQEVRAAERDLAGRVKGMERAPTRRTKGTLEKSARKKC